MTIDTTPPTTGPTNMRLASLAIPLAASLTLLDPDAFRRHLVSAGADPQAASRWAEEAYALFRRLPTHPDVQSAASIRLPLSLDELEALDTLLSAVYHDPGTGAFVGLFLRDWRDHLDALHRKTTALVDAADPSSTPP